MTVEGYVPSGPQTTDVKIAGVETTVSTPVEIPPEEEAAAKFTKLLPYVNKLANAMNSKGGLVRVLTAFAEFPLGGKQPRLQSEQERQLFLVMNELQGYKSTVVTSFIKQAAEMEQMKQNAVSTTAEGETNV